MEIRLYITLAVMWALPISTLDAQTPAAKSQDDAYLIPFDTEGNRIELTVANETSAAYEDVEVRVGDVPEWLQISDVIPTDVRDGLPPHNSRVFQFTFSVDDSAPTEVAHALIFEIYSGDELVVSKQIDISVELPKELVLRGNYLNPFNPSTTIGFVQPEDGDLTLEIFDALGRQVEQLDRYGAKRGQQTISWNATTRATGVYVYRLQLRTDTGLKETRLGKMLLVK